MMPEKLYFVVNARMPTEKAHGVHIAHMCSALAKSGFDVTLVVPNRGNAIQEDVYAYYDVPRNFSIARLAVIDVVGSTGAFGFALATVSFALSSLLYLWRKRGRAIVYTRGEMPLFLADILPRRYSIFWESHIKTKSFRRYGRVLKRAAGIIVATKAWRDELSSHGVPAERVFSAPLGVDVAGFSSIPSKADACRALGLDPSGRIAVYVGSDLSWKGTDTLKAATRLLPIDAKVVFVGAIAKGEADDIHAVFVGAKPPREVPTYLAAADALVLTGTARSEISMRYTSPLKMFEYMASGRPIVASDVPSFRDVLNDKSAFFVAPDDPKALADGIVRALESGEGAARAAAAKHDAAQYDWAVRAARIYQFIEERIRV